MLLGPVIGASGGYTFDSTSVLAFPFETITFPSNVRRDTFAFAVNFNLFRLAMTL